MSAMKLPEGWQIKPLGETFTFTKKPKGLRYTDFEQVPFVPMDFVPIGDLYFDRYELRSTEKLSSGTYFEPGDVLIAKITPSFENGKQGVIKILPTSFGVATTEVIPIKGIEGVSDNHYIFYYLLRSDVRSQLAGKMEGSTGRQRLSKTTLASFEIPLPPLPEQRAIAHALRTVQQAREARQRELALEWERKAALMDFVFTQGIYDEPRQQTDIGEIPQSWRVVKLGECIADGPQNGIYKPAKLYGEGTPIIRIDTFDNDGLFTTLDFKRVKLSNDEVNRYLVSERDILINRVNSLSHLGKSVLIPNLPEKTVFESNMMRLHVDETKLLPEYLIRYLITGENKERMRGKARRAVAQSSINQGDVKSLLIPVPPLSEQQEIANVLQACDDKIGALERESALLDELFRAMLEELMTGQIRIQAGYEIQ